MSLPQHTPGEGGRRPRTHFTYVGPHKGKAFSAWMAGPAHWFLCHTKSKTQPCLHEMTGGELTCERCEQGHGIEEIGYVPLWREIDGKPVMVIVHDYVRETVDCLRLHQRVLVGRGEDDSDGVYVIPALKPDPKFQTTLADKMKPADLTQTLLRVWRLPDLVTWYEQTHGAQPVKPQPKEPARAKINGRDFRAPTLRAATDVAQQLQDGASLDAAIDVAEERWRRAATESKNGRKPK